MSTLAPKYRHLALVAVALAATVTLAACSPAVSNDTSNNDRDSSSSDEDSKPESGDDVAEAAELVMQRYEYVRDGDYEAACELYSDDYAELFIELANAAGETCEDAHALAAQNALDYMDEAADQERAGLIPFFFVPSAIEVDESAIKNDEPGLVYLGSGTVVSLDDTEFEDGAGETPGWLASQDYLKKDDDGNWHFISALEQ